MKINELLELHARTKKLIKIKPLLQRFLTITENRIIPFDNYENHENLRIPIEKYENH